MHIPLSKRLQRCCDFVHAGDRVADIGCDHGYLGIYLLLCGVACHVIAADINPMPLQSAVANAEKFGINDRIEFHLSDGAKDIPRDFDTLVCAGMGADTIVSILEGAPWLKDDQYRLILQCQSKTPMLRRYLSDNGWQIDRETVLRDGRFLYTVMSASRSRENSHLTIGQTYFPPALLAQPTPELREYYENIVFRLRRAIAGQKDAADHEMVAALKELEALEGEII